MKSQFRKVFETHLDPALSDLLSVGGWTRWPLEVLSSASYSMSTERTWTCNSKFLLLLSEQWLQLWNCFTCLFYKAKLNACKMTEVFICWKTHSPNLIYLCVLSILQYFRKIVTYQWQYFLFLGFYFEAVTVEEV